MKILSMFCVIVVLVLNMVPCADAHDHSDAPISASFSVANAGEPHAGPLADACTPFCHCSCCAASMVVKLQPDLIPPFPVFQTSAIPHFELRSIDVSLSVWQPPKLV